MRVFYLPEKAEYLNVRITGMHYRIPNPGLMAVFPVTFMGHFAQGIDVYHAVLDIGKILFNGMVDTFRNLMGLQQGQVIVGADFHIYKDAAAKLAGAQQVDVIDAGNLGNLGPHGVFFFFGAGFINHFVNGAHKDFIAGLQDHQADYHAGDGIQDRVAHAGAQNTDEAADGRQGIAAMVPGVCHQSIGFQHQRIMTRVPVHGFFNYNRNDGLQWTLYPGA